MVSLFSRARRSEILKRARRDVKLNMFAFGTPWLPIYYVNIDLRHQYEMSVAESQTYLLAKLPKRRGVTRNGCSHRLVLK